MATMDDIAHALGITKGTVSKAFSGADDISESMRKAVLEKAVELGYTRIMRSREVKKICIFIVHMSYENTEDFGHDIVTGFRKIAEPAGYIVDIIKLTDDMQKEHSYDEFMLRENYLGALFLGLSLNDPWIGCFSSCRTPTVLYDNSSHGNPVVTQIGIDNSEGMRLAVGYLKELGHQRIGYMSSELKSFVYQQRYHAYFDAMEEYGLKTDSSLTASALQASECIKKHMPRLISQGCTAIICSHDLLALGAMIYCEEHGIGVPDDISFISFDDIPLARYTSPPLTTIRQNRTELGKSAFYALTSQMNSVPISTLLLHAQLIKRESAAPLHGDQNSL